MVNMLQRKTRMNDGFGISKVVTSTHDKKEDKKHGKLPKNSKMWNCEMGQVPWVVIGWIDLGRDQFIWVGLGFNHIEWFELELCSLTWVGFEVD